MEINISFEATDAEQVPRVEVVNVIDYETDEEEDRDFDDFLKSRNKKKTKHKTSSLKESAAEGINELKEAVEVLTSAITQNPDDCELFYERSGHYIKLKNYEGALSDAEKTVQLKPDWWMGHHRKGAVQTCLEQHFEAVSSYKRALELNPQNETLRNDYDSSVFEACLSPKRKEFERNCIRLEIDYDIEASYILSLAARHNHFRMVPRLIRLELGAGVNKLNNKGRTPLMEAAIHGSFESLLALIDGQADVNKKDEDRTPSAAGTILDQRYITKGVGGGKTALHYAAYHGHLNIIEKLLKAGADFEAYDRYNRSVLHFAVCGGHLETIKFVQELSVSRNLHLEIDGEKVYSNMKLTDAVIERDVKKVESLLQQGADPNYVPFKEYCSPNTSTSGGVACANLLNLAIKNQTPELVSLLLDAGADVNNQDEEGNSVLLNALHKCPEEVVLQVFAKNPNVHLTNKKGEAPLPKALFNSSDKVVGAIMAKMPDVNTKDEHGQTPLYSAITKKRTLWLQPLLEAGAKLEDSSLSPLDLAVIGGDMNTIQILVSLGQYDFDAMGGAESMCHAYGHHQAAWWLNKQILSICPNHTIAREMAVRDINARLASFSKLCLQPYTSDCWPEYFRSCQLVDRLTASGSRIPASLQETFEVIQHNIVEAVNVQDRDGRTQLHEAAENGHVDRLKILLDLGAVPKSFTYGMVTPLDLATQNKHHEAEQLLRRIKDNEVKYPADKCQLYWELLSEISRYNADDGLSIIKKVTSLLSCGAPLTPPGSFSAYPLHLAITSNCNRILPTLVTAGAPLVSSVCGLGLVQLAWLTPDITSYVGVFIARAVAYRLEAEMKFKPLNDLDLELKIGIRSVVECLQGDKPWSARYPSKRLTTEKLTDLLIRACSHGAITAAWWLRQEGGSTIFPESDKGITALQAALLAEHYQTASDLVHHLGTNPFVPNREGQMPIDIFPKEQKPLILQGCLVREVTKLDGLLARTLTGHVKQQEEVMRHILLFSILYLTVCEEINMLKEDLEKFYAYSLQSEEEMFSFLKESYLSDVGDGFWKLLDHQKKLYIDFCVAKQSQTFDLEKNRVLLNCVITDALKLCSERKFPLYLHLLVDIASVNVNRLVDNVCHTTALHHTAISGNLSAATYLLSRGAEVNVKDSTYCTPVHYASMFGHKITADYLISQDASGLVLDSRCSNGYTASDYRVAFTKYMKTLCIEQEAFALPYNDPSLLTQHHLKKLEKSWMNRGIVKSVREANVDFSCGEAAEIQEAVVNSVKSLLSRVASENSIFEGELKQLGSSADGVRLFSPDEFDFNIILNHKLSGLSNGGLNVELKEYDEMTAACKGYDRYISVTAHQEELSKWVKGSELLPEFLRLIKLCLTDFSFEDCRLNLVPPGVKYKMVGAGLTLRWSGKQYPLLLIDIDLVPVVQASWPNNLYCPPLLTPDVQNIYASTSLTDEWRLSSGILENNIMQNLTKKQKDVFLACKMLVSTLKVDGWVPTQIKQQYRYFDSQLFRIPVLNGFILKNCFFEEMENRREEEYWQEDKLLDRLQSIFQRMCHQENNQSYKDGIRYVPRQIYAYFGGAIVITKDSGERVVSGATDKSYVGYGAPEILQTLNSLRNSHIRHNIPNFVPKRKLYSDIDLD